MGWTPIQNLLKFEVLKYIYKNINALESNIKFFEQKSGRSTRSKINNHLIKSSAKLSYTQNSIFHKGIELWNTSDVNTRAQINFEQFCKAIECMF